MTQQFFCRTHNLIGPTSAGDDKHRAQPIVHVRNSGKEIMSRDFQMKLLLFVTDINVQKENVFQFLLLFCQFMFLYLKVMNILFENG